MFVCLRVFVYLFASSLLISWSTCLHECIYVSVPRCACARTYVCLHVCMSACMHACMCTCMYARMYARVQLCTHAGIIL